MIREIVTDEEILSKPCEAATAEDAAIADDLVETLLASDEAMCLHNERAAHLVWLCVPKLLDWSP